MIFTEAICIFTGRGERKERHHEALRTILSLSPPSNEQKRRRYPEDICINTWYKVVQRQARGNRMENDTLRVNWGVVVVACKGLRIDVYGCRATGKNDKGGYKSRDQDDTATTQGGRRAKKTQHGGADAGNAKGRRIFSSQCPCMRPHHRICSSCSEPYSSGMGYDPRT